MELRASAVHQDGMRFTVTAGSHSLTTDYPLNPDETGVGPRPLELLLASLASCAAGAMVALLRRAGQPFAGLTVTASGDRRAEHPTVFTSIALDYVVRGPVDPSVVASALAQSEERICPVWAMLKPGTRLTSTFRVEP